MPIHKVTGKDSSKAGKPRVYFDGKSGWEDAFYVSDKCNVPDVGITIEAVTASNEYRGRTYWYLNDWKRVAGSEAVPVPTPSQHSGNGQSQPVAPAMQPQKGWDIQSGDLSRYASNIVASAIAAGLIKDPKDMMRWASAAYASAEGLRSGRFQHVIDPLPDPNEDQDRDPDADRDFDDRIPF